MCKQVKSCAGKESFHRMNFLHQASKFTSKLSLNSNKSNEKQNLHTISTYYSNLMINIAKRSVLRIDTDIKRDICKGCHCILILGETARVRIRKKPKHHVRYTCLKCKTSKIYNTDKNYELWNEKPEALVEILEYGDELINGE